MRRYLATLHEKPEHHKKQFAFVVSATFTAILFVSWTVIKFGASDIHIAKPEPKDIYTAAAHTDEVSPLETLKASVHDAWTGVTEGVNDLKDSAKSVDVESQYQEIRRDALENAVPESAQDTSYGE